MVPRYEGDSECEISVYKSLVLKAAVCDCVLELDNHTRYSSDLAQSDYDLFPNMKKKNTYVSDNAVIIAADYFFDQPDPSTATLMEELYEPQREYVKKISPIWLHFMRIS